MSASAPSDPNGSSELLVDIVEILERNGLPRDSYHLYDSVDVELLEKFLASSEDDVTVQLTVEGLELIVTKDSVTVIRDSALA